MQTQEISKALQLKEELDQLRPLSKEQEGRIMQKFRLDWNYHSNHLEGNSLSYGETKALILFGITAQGKPLKDHFEITGHDEAIKWVTEIVKEERPLTESFIREIHKLLLKESYEKDAISPEGIPTKRRIAVGQYKSTPNHVLTKTDEIFYFASPEETPAKMNDLMDWYRTEKEAKTLNSISFAAKFHYDFIRIHPFDDGNGRTARILMNFILMQSGFPPVIIKTEDKENYFAVLRLADAGQLEPFITYIAQNLNRSLELMIKGAKGENIDEPEDLDKELALLEQRLKRLEKGVKITDIKKAKLEVFDDSISRLKAKFISECEKFGKMYTFSQFNVTADLLKVNINIGNQFGLNVLRNLLEDRNIKIHFFLNFDFENLNNILFKDAHYESNIKIELNESTYSISTQAARNNTYSAIEKPYTEQLSDEEIATQVKYETDRHKAFIESKIKEAEGKLNLD